MDQLYNSITSQFKYLKLMSTLLWLFSELASLSTDEVDDFEYHGPMHFEEYDLRVIPPLSCLKEIKGVLVLCRSNWTNLYSVRLCFARW